MDLPGRSCQHGNSSCVTCPDCQVDIRWGGSSSSEDELLDNEDKTLQQGLMQDIETRNTTVTDVMPEDDILQERDEIEILEIQAQNRQQEKAQDTQDCVIVEEILQSEEEMPESQPQSKQRGTSFEDFWEYCNDDKATIDEKTEKEIMQGISEDVWDELLVFYYSELIKEKAENQNEMTENQDEWIEIQDEMNESEDEVLVFKRGESNLNQQEIMPDGNSTSTDGGRCRVCDLDDGDLLFIQRSKNIVTLRVSEDSPMLNMLAWLKSADEETDERDEGINEGEERTDEGEDTTDTGVKRIDEGYKRTDEEEVKTDEGIKKTAGGVKRTAEGVKRTAEGIKKTAEGVKRKAEGEERINEGEERINEGEGKTDDLDEMIDEGDKRIDEGEERTDEGVKRIDEEDKRTDEEEERTDEGVKRTAVGVKRKAKGEKRINEGEGKTDEGDERIDEGDERIDEGDKKIDEGDKRTYEGYDRIDEREERTDGEVGRKDEGDKRTDEEEVRTDEGKERTAEGKERTAEGKERIAEVEEHIAEGEERTVEGDERIDKGEERTDEGDEWAYDGDESSEEGDEESNETPKGKVTYLCSKCYIASCEKVAQELHRLRQLQLQNIQEVFDRNILEENSEEQLTDSTTQTESSTQAESNIQIEPTMQTESTMPTQSTIQTESQVFLTEKYIEFPGRWFKEKSPEASPEEKMFFEFARAVLLGTETDFCPDDFLTVHPNVEVSVTFFLKFICEENKHCSDPEILEKFLTVIATLLALPTVVLNEIQLKLLVQFLLFCLYVDIHCMKHFKFRQTVAQMLSLFTNGSGIVARKLYEDIVQYFKKSVLYFPLEAYQWNAILVTIKYMGVSAIQSVIMSDFLQISDFIKKSLKSLEPFNITLISANRDATSDNQKKEREKFIDAIKTYMDASNLHAQLLKLCAFLIEEVIKEDIRTHARVVYVNDEINALLGDHAPADPEPVKYKFNHENFKPFLDASFSYFGDALMPYISSIFSKYEKSNWSKALFFKQKYKLIPVENVYLTEENANEIEQIKEQQKKERLEEIKFSFDKSTTRRDYYERKYAFLNRYNRRLGSVLKSSNKKKDEYEHYLNCIKDIPQPWLNVLSAQYRVHHKTEPQHWRFTGNLETYI